MVHDTSVSHPYVLFNRGNTEGTNSSKLMFLMLMHVLFYINLSQDCFRIMFVRFNTKKLVENSFTVYMTFVRDF